MRRCPIGSPAFMARLSKAPGVAARALILTILTAAHTSEILGLLWTSKSSSKAT